MPPPLLIDTHSHLNASAFDGDREVLVAEAVKAGVENILLCPGCVKDIEKTRRIAHQFHLSYAIGIHPMYLPHTADAVRDLAIVRREAEVSLDDPLFAAIGEIGLDGFVPGIDPVLAKTVFSEQLRIARDLSLPVSVHARHAMEDVIVLIKKLEITQGAIHAFNGSWPQAERLFSRGMKLGFGGAVTYTGSLRIRRTLAALPDDAFVLETDAPDMPSSDRRASKDQRTHPADLLSYAEQAAKLRKTTTEEVVRLSRENAFTAFPRMRPTN